MSGQRAFSNPFDVVDGEERVKVFAMPATIEQALGKVAKRDVKTRNRGFAELLETLTAMDGETLAAVAVQMRPSFVVIFNKYSLAAERTTRLAVAQVTALLMTHADARTFVQPMLRAIVTRWMMSLFDPAGEVARIQRRGFEAVFPASKLPQLCVAVGGIVLQELASLATGEALAQLRDTAMMDMGGTGEEAAATVELAKTEMVGVLALLATRWVDMDRAVFSAALPSVLFLHESGHECGREMSSPRRAALYRLHLSLVRGGLVMRELQAVVVELVSREDAPLALPAALELMGNLLEERLLEKQAVFSRERTVAITAHLPLEAFKDHRALVTRYCVAENLLAFAVVLVEIANNNVTMNRERFLVFWSELAVSVFARGETTQRVDWCRQLLFANLRRGVKAFVTLTAEETMRCVCAAFRDEEIVAACRGQEDAAVQRAFVLSHVAEDAPFLEALETLSIDDLSRPELARRVPEGVRVERAAGRVAACVDPRELARLLALVPPEAALVALREKQLPWDDWLVLAGIVTRETLVDVLFQTLAFRAAVQECGDVERLRPVIVAAFECSVAVFDSDGVSELLECADVVEECLSAARGVCPSSPLLASVLHGGQCRRHPAIAEMSLADRNVLFECVKVAEDMELYLAMRPADERFFPLAPLRQMNADGVLENLSPEELVSLVACATEKRDMREIAAIVAVGVKNTAVVREVALAAFLHGLVPTAECAIVQAFERESDSFHLWSQFVCLQRLGVETPSLEPVSFESLRSCLRFHLHFYKSDSAALNAHLSKVIFPETGAMSESTCHGLMLALSIEPVLPVRTDNISGLLAGCTRDSLLWLFVSRHAARDDIDRVFWRTQWVELLRQRWRKDERELEACCAARGDEQALDEVRCRAAAALWNVLDAPDEELLPQCAEQLKLPLVESDSWRGARFGLARLFLVAAPLLQPLPSLNDLVEAMRGRGAEECSPHGQSPQSDPTVATMLAYRSAAIMLHMDEALVRSQVQLSTDSVVLDSETLGAAIFPLWSLFAEEDGERDCRWTLILLELFVSWAEGGRDDALLQSAFHDVFKRDLVSRLVHTAHRVLAHADMGHGAMEDFDFTPREIDAELLLRHVLFRCCGSFPLVMGTQPQPQLLPVSDSVELLCRRELDRIRRNGMITTEAVVVTLRPAIASTMSTVRVNVCFAGEINLEMTLHLPRQFPLEPVRVEGVSKSGLGEAKWRAARLSLQSQLRSSAFNGNVVEAVRRWTGNVARLFEGMEECAVCYCVVHPSDRSLPGPVCKTCKHRFHATCLYKWFKSSGNATCPLCRGLF